MKAWYASKSIIFGALVALAGALEHFAGVLETTDGIPAWVLMVIGAIVVVLRSVTKQPVGASTEP